MSKAYQDATKIKCNEGDDGVWIDIENPYTGTASVDGTSWAAAIATLICVHEEAMESHIDRLRAALASWQRSNEAMEWLDDNSPLVRQTREVLDD